MAIAISTNLTGVSDKGLQEAYLAGVASANVDLSWMGIFPYDGKTWQAQLYAPPSAFSSATEGDDIITEAVEETDALTITVASFSLGYGISDLAQRTINRDVLVRLYKQLGALGVRFFASECYDLLNNATGTTQTADGVALGATSHTLEIGTASNFANAALSFANYAVADQMLRDQVNDRGTLMGGMATRLIVPTDLRILANQIMSSAFSADDRSQNNVDQGAHGVTTAGDLTSATRWFLTDDNQTSFRCPVVRGPSPWEVRDQKSLNYEVRDLAHIGTGVVDWRGVVVG